MSNHDETVYSLPRLIAFASPAFTVGALGLPLIIFLPPLYAELGLDLAIVGGIFMVARFFDVITDPVFGIVGDKVRTPLGRRRPVLIASVPVLLVGIYFAFNPAEVVSQTYALSFLLLLYLGWTMFTLSHTTWARELSTGYHERSRVMSIVSAASLFGAFAIVIVPATFDALAPDTATKDKVSAMGWFLILPMPFLVALSLWAGHENPAAQPAPMKWREAIAAIFQNRPLRRLLLADLLSGLQSGVNGSLHLFFVALVLKMPQAASGYIVLIFLSSFLFVPVWLQVSYRFGKHRTLCYIALFSAFASGSALFVPEQGFMIGAVVYVLIGVGLGASGAMMRAIMADVVDEDTLVTQNDRGALFYAMLTMTDKLGLALAVGITYPILNWIGFDANGVNDQSTLDGVRWVMVFTPLLINILIVFIMWRFPLDEARQQEVARLLAEKT